MADTAPNGESLLDITKDNATAAYDSVTNGPVAQNVKEQQLKTQTEFSNLAASRRTPVNPAATGQPLTHYHSFFSELLSWKNPRASAIAYASIVSFIFVARYLDLIRWAFKLSSVVLSVTVAAEIAGKAVLNHGLATQMRPRRYITVSRATLDKFIGDVHELINFFVIEAQRILFVENIGASAATCFTAFVSYHLVKLVPYWGLAILATTVAFFVPLVYTTNQELIDQQLKNASEAICAQTAQVRSVAQKQADHIAAVSKQYAGNYTGKVQEMLRGRGAAPSLPASSPQQPAPAAPIERPVSAAPIERPVSAAPIKQPDSAAPIKQPDSAAPIKQPEFPAAPTEEPELKKVAQPQGLIPTEPDNVEAEPLIAS